jgi:tRNA threonylcarbamoyladenosine biosynthesis protein TsaB
MHLSEQLIAHIDALLKTVSATIRDIDCFAVGIGPGSFTGTRIGVMTVKTFAYFHNVPIFAVNSLETIAAEYAGLPQTIVTPILPCRRGVVYACPYAVERDEPEALAKPDAYSFADLGLLLNALDPKPALFCGPAARSYAIELRAALGVRAEEAAFGAAEYPRAAVIGRLALTRLSVGAAPADPLAVTPLYISPPPITLPKTPIPGGSG